MIGNKPRTRSSAICSAITAAFVLATSLAYGKNDEPVTVQGVVGVEGAVEVLNDLMYEPFVQSSFVSDSVSPTLTFDIPDGKRLIIETIAFQASRPTNEWTRMFLHPRVSNQSQLIPLPVQFTSNEDTVSYLISVIPMKLRLDAEVGSSDEIRIRRGTGAPGSLFATVSGYLVDL